MRYQGQGYELNVPFRLRQVLEKGTEPLTKLFNKSQKMLLVYNHLF